MQVGRGWADTVTSLFFCLLVFAFKWPRCGGSLYECLVPMHYCLGPFLPIGYHMQQVRLNDSIVQLRRLCPTISQVEGCMERYRCNHEPTRRRMETYTQFFQWLCDMTQVLEENAACWEFPFDNDVITCGERHIAGLYGSRLGHVNHPCPYVQGMVACFRERTEEREECSETAIQLYINIIIKSSKVFAGCPRV